MNLITGKRVLVTGGAGFIGSALCHDLLERDNEVVCLDNFATGRKENLKELKGNPHFKLIDGDIRDQEVCRKAVKGVDVVLHQAALGSVPRSIADPATTNAANKGRASEILMRPVNSVAGARSISKLRSKLRAR